MSDEIIVINVSEESVQSFKRLDQFLSEQSELSRNIIKDLFQKGAITSSEKLKLNKMPKPGTVISIVPPEPIAMDAQPENIPLDILFEDSHLLFVNKPAGMVVHPAPGNYSGTLVNALLYHVPDLAGIGGVQRPGIVHRLDKGTSGVMVVAKNQKTHAALVELFSEHDLNRRYIALTSKKEISHSGIIKTMIDRHKKNRLKMTSLTNSGKEAITNYKTLKEFENCLLMELKLHTGRTHQIRVHLSEKLKCPIINDYTYGNPKQQIAKLPESIQALLANYDYPLLHAQTLGLKHPITGELLEYTTEPPQPFSKIIETLS